jgi:hypothetical protein
LGDIFCLGWVGICDRVAGEVWIFDIKLQRHGQWLMGRRRNGGRTLTLTLSLTRQGRGGHVIGLRQRLAGSPEKNSG